MKGSPKKTIEERAHDISYHAKKRVDMFRKLKLNERVEVFFLLSPHIQQTLIEVLSVKELVVFIDHLDLDQAGQILARIKHEHKRKSVAHRLKQDLKEKVEYFLQFSPRAEFSLLSFNYILVSPEITVGQVAVLIDQHYKEAGKTPEVLIRKDGRCVGEVLMSNLVLKRNTIKLSKLMSPVVSLNYRSSKNEIKKVFTHDQKKKVVVTDTDGSVIGIIYTDDVLHLFKHGPAEALYDFAGVVDSERVADEVMVKVEHRYKWLLINLGTAFLAAFVVSLFENTINEVVLLAVYMPVVAGMGGNAGTQTLAVMVRGITLGEVSWNNVKEVLKKEVGAGVVNGLIVGLVVALVASFINHSPLFGLVIGVSMIFNLFIAGFFGALVPVVMKTLGKDPATSAGIFITTATDVFGFLSFLGLATLLLV